MPAKASPNAERPIVIASNRLPFTFQRTQKGLVREPSSGGLVSALEPVLRKRGGTWVGWHGVALRDGEALDTGGVPYRIAPIDLSESEIARYYHGFSNRTLWPLMHSFPETTRFERRDYEIYSRVNERFAETVVSEAGDAGLVWVHDYQLMLAPPHIRSGLPETLLAFFLHIPFPPYDVFRLLPWDREILRALLACDLIGFHVGSYAENFLACVERSLGARVDRAEMLVEYGNRTTRVGAFPIGIEFAEYETLARDAPKQPEMRRERVILGVDRLDYTKGIPERIRGYERLLETHPEYREKVVLLQLAVPSRGQVAEYKHLKREIDELVGRVNGRFASADWSPIRYIHRSHAQDRLAALYRYADVCLVTPLRDGMNLVAKEFVACQVDDPGVLILSKLAGAAQTMREALRVNPYDVDGMAEAIHRALSMDESERASRMLALRLREERDDVDAWVQLFLEEATSARAALRPLSDADFTDWLGEFLGTHRLALFLDYDGTLTPLREHPSKAKIQRRIREAVSRCADRADTDVAIISGRSLGDVRAMVKLPKLTYAGNHGLEIEGPGLEHFVHEDLPHYRERADELAAELEAVAVEGAWVEAKGPTLTFHYRAVPEDRSAPLIEEAQAIIHRAGYQARHAHAAIEARPPIGWDKGRAVLHILRARYGPSWSETVRVVYVGDDETDEDAFRFLSGLSLTFRVGSPDTPTAAARRLADVSSVRALVEWLGARSAPRGRRSRAAD